LSVIESCAGWDGGNYDANPKACATNALSVLIPYFYSREWWDQYVDTPEAYTKWRNHWGDYYLDIQDARDLFYLQKSVTLGWLGDTPGFKGDVDAALASVRAKTLFIYNTRDQFYLPHHMEDTVKAVPKARGVAIDSNAGHLMCCNADPQATWIMGEAIRKFLQELSAE
jgi:homoserine O-acetyltransferase